jgi:hypothetical protein
LAQVVGDENGVVGHGGKLLEAIEGGGSRKFSKL